MATPETKVKDYLRDELSRLSALLDIPIKVVANPAGSMSIIGREDVDLVFANVLYVHAEIKREGKALELAQKIHQEGDYGYFRVVIVGKGGVRNFIDNMPLFIRQGLPGYIHGFTQLTKTVDANIDQYIQDRERRASIAAKGPRRQSAELH